MGLEETGLFIGIIAIILAITAMGYSFYLNAPVDFTDIENQIQDTDNSLLAMQTLIDQKINRIESEIIDLEDDLRDFNFKDYGNDIEDLEDDLDDAERDVRDILGCFEDHDSHSEIKDCIRDI